MNEGPASSPDPEFVANRNEILTNADSVAYKSTFSANDGFFLGLRAQSEGFLRFHLVLTHRFHMSWRS